MLLLDFKVPVSEGHCSAEGGLEKQAAWRLLETQHSEWPYSLDSPEAVENKQKHLEHLLPGALK